MFPLCIALLLITHFLRANTSTNDYLIKQYTDEHGLPQNSIKGIGCDNLGFVWLISEKGPVRYDGNGHFRTFDELSAALKIDRMVSLHREHRTNELWTQSESDEMITLRDGKPTITDKHFHDIFDNFPAYTKQTSSYHLRLPLHEDKHRSGHLVIPDGTGGNFIVGPDTVAFCPPYSPSPTTSTAFRSSHPWRLAGLAGKLIYFEQLHHYTEINGSAQIAKKTIKGDLQDLPTSTPFSLYWNSAAGQLFIHAADGLYLISETPEGNLHSTLLLTGFDFQQHHIIAVYYMASQEKILLGSTTEGLFVIKKRRFKTLLVNGPLANNVFYIQTPLPEDRLLTNYGVSFDGSGQSQRIAALADKKHQYGQILGPQGNIWVLLSDSILVLSPDAQRLIGIKPNPMLAKVVYRDHRSGYWLGGDRNVLTHYHADRDSFVNKAYLPDVITYIECFGSEQLLIGTHGGLYVYRIIDSVLEEIPAFNGKYIRSIRRESDSRYWITTYQHGFFLYEDGVATPFPLDQNRYLATSHCTLEDQHGFLWISTNKGLFKVSKKQLLAYRNDTDAMPFYFYYNKSWGFNTNEFNGGCQPCAIELRDGRFSFPSLHGLVQFDPLAVIDEFPAGAIVIDEVLLNGNRLSISDTINIPRHFSRLDVKLATPFYGNLHNMEIEYVLDRKERQVDEWLPINFPQNTLSINDLPSGNHALNIRMRNGPGPKDFQYASVHFYVQPLFHETWWFTAVFCMGIGLIIWLMIYIRTQLVLKQNRWLSQKVNERTEDLKKQYEWQQHLSASITHDIKAPLHYVVQTLHAMQSMAKAQRITSGEIQQIYHATQHIYQYSNNLTNLSRIMRTKEWLVLRDVCLHQVVQSQVDIFLPIVKLRGNTMTNDIPQDTIINAHADILSVIIHNILDNAIKFTKGGMIRVRIEKIAPGMVSFSISDTGIGLRPEQVAYYNANQHFQTTQRATGKETGLGIVLAKDMAKLINAQMYIRSVLGEGTTIVLTLHQNHVNGPYQSAP